MRLTSIIHFKDLWPVIALGRVGIEISLDSHKIGPRGNGATTNHKYWQTSRRYKLINPIQYIYTTQSIILPSGWPTHTTRQSTPKPPVGHLSMFSRKIRHGNGQQKPISLEIKTNCSCCSQFPMLNGDNLFGTN